ncbi:MAG TPA: MFS transporter [Thermoanaerobaculia bacterium]|nr:MFS transporter [Thermoanaerobaculia bacterium]
MAAGARRAPLARNVIVLGGVSLLTDVASEMAYPLLPLFLTGVLGASATALGAIEGVAQSVSSLLKLGSGWLSDRLARRKPLVFAGYALASVVRPFIGLAQSAGQVMAIRVADRIGKGVRTSPRDALIADATDPSMRGRAFGFHRAADNIGAVVGPLLAFALLRYGRGIDLRRVFLLTAIPAVLSLALLVFGLKETRRASPPPPGRSPELGGVPLLAPLGKRFWACLAVLFVFTLGNSSDAFLLLRAAQLGIAPALVPILWALFNLVKAAGSGPAGALSDRLGRRPLLVAGYAVYALVYFALGQASAAWQVWALFALYGVYFSLTEGVERALIADFVPAQRRGAAFGWYNLATGIGALPASLLFGAISDRTGAPAALDLGAALALLAAIGIFFVVPGQTQSQQESPTDAPTPRDETVLR